jgi:hypothetical protein
MQILLYILVLLAVTLPIVFRRIFWVRVASVFLLGFLAVIHLVFLLTEHRLVLERGVQHYGASPTKPLPDDFRAAVGMIQDLSQPELLFAAALFVALVILALLPFCRSDKSEVSHDA